MESSTVLGTFAWAVILGVLIVQFAHQLRISAIVFLLLGGIIAGPNVLGLIQPELLGTEALKTIVALAIGLILFEGGLTLDIRDYRRVSSEIKRLLSTGVLITWLSCAFFIHFIFSFSWEFSLLSASLVIVTGPTVIGPLLKRIHAEKKLSSILHWEGVLIDPIGVFIALLCYDWIVSGGEHALFYFAKRCLVGVGVGLAMGWLVSWVIRKSWLDQENLNGFMLAAALAIFTLSEYFVHESGLLAVILAGFLIGSLDKGQLDQVKAYKAQLIEILIGMLFMLLAANLNLQAFPQYGIELLAIILVVMFVIRPLNIFLSTVGAQLSLREKLFLCWIAPRGIVAASMASLFALGLSDIYPSKQAQFLETFTYSVIIATVFFQGLTAKWVGKKLGVLTSRPNGWLIIGSHALGRKLGEFLQSQQIPVVMMDSNIRRVRQAQEKGLVAFQSNALLTHSEEFPELYEVGNVLVITPNGSLNTLLEQHWRRELPEARIYSSRSRGESHDQQTRQQVIWEKLPVRKLVGKDSDELPIKIEESAPNEIIRPEEVLFVAWGKNAAPHLPETLPDNVESLQVVRYIRKARPTKEANTSS